MGETTAIAWTDHTFNPWWGCERVSPGCQHCYAEVFAKRTGNDVWGKNAERRFFGDKHWDQPHKWNRRAAADGRQHLVFCASMADVFEDRPELQIERNRLWNLIEVTHHLTWQLLTKRPQNVMDMVPTTWKRDPAGTGNRWPHNVWIGTTVMDEVGLGPAPKPPVEVEALFAARFAGSCPECHLEIHEGQRIARLSDGRYVHEGCV